MARWGCRDCLTEFGAWLSRCPRCGSAKELVVALNACNGCTTKFAVGLPRCPHCGSTDFCEDGQMAKITAHGGASDKTLAAPAPEAETTEVEATEPPDVTEYMAGPAQQESAPVDGENLLPDDTSAAPEEEPEAPSEPEPESGYEAWTVEELKAELVERGLPKSGKRDDLVQRLAEDDAARTAESGTE